MWLNLLPEVVLHHNVWYEGTCEKLFNRICGSYLAALCFVGLSLLQLCHVSDLNISYFLSWIIQRLTGWHVDLCHLLNLWLAPSQSLDLLFQTLNLGLFPLLLLISLLQLFLLLPLYFQSILSLYNFILDSLVLNWFGLARIFYGVHGFFISTHLLVDARNHYRFGTSS